MIPVRASHVSGQARHGWSRPAGVGIREISRLLFLSASLLLGGSCNRTAPAGPELVRTVDTAARARAVDLLVNPLFAKGADPWIIEHDGMYHYCYSRDNAIRLKSAPRLSGLPYAPERTLWTPPPGTDYSREIWAPELHYLDGKWYVYFAADDGDNQNHRMYALASATAALTPDFSFVGQVTDATDRWAIDGTVIEISGQRYFVWSGWEGEVNEAQHLYIARMAGPTAITSERVRISSPEYAWEKRGACGGLPTINEGPQVLKHGVLGSGGHLYLIYSASGSWSDDYCLGQLELIGTDPMRPDSWRKHPRPVFKGTESVISPGHCSFLWIGGRDYIVYHHIRTKGGGWTDRQVKVQPFYWSPQGAPVFGVPVQDSAVVEVEYGSRY